MYSLLRLLFFNVTIADLDHTADVQCHSWGVDLVEAFQNMAPCMLNYMTDITKVREDPDETINIRISGYIHIYILIAYC